MKTRMMIPVVAALSLALAAGCQRRSADDGQRRSDDEVIGSAHTTGATDVPGGADTSGATGTTATTGATGTTAAKPLDDRDKEFLTKAAQGGLAEIALGSAAAQSATLPELKTFAQRMVTDHNKANDELKALAAKKGVALPTAVDKDDQKEQATLMKLTDKKFDKEYAEYMVKDHQEDVREFEKEAKDGKDPEIKAWAAKMVPTLQDHLQQARAIEKVAKNAKSTDDKGKR